MNTVQEQITAFENTRAAKTGRMNELMSKAASTGVLKGSSIESVILSGQLETVITAHPVGSDQGCATSDIVGLEGMKDDIKARFVKPIAGLISLLEQSDAMPLTVASPAVKVPGLPAVLCRRMWQKIEEKAARDAKEKGKAV
jgi:hypothetical protein